LSRGSDPTTYLPASVALRFYVHPSEIFQDVEYIRYANPRHLITNPPDGAHCFALHLAQEKKRAKSGTINQLPGLIMTCNHAWHTHILYPKYNDLPLASKHQEVRTIRKMAKWALKS